ncbi:GATA transcription factor 4-like [Humulus lupulus]|uniref:GATA transcription factor 4-like n=1 Tax=Humulus lupulus TaxID=3486 RepID=UPI002B40077B|nr:GATA transcription factor 4-like [Humulus lupulus]
MDHVYGSLPTHQQDCFGIDDLLDFSNNEDNQFLSSSSNSDVPHHHHYLPPLLPQTSASAHFLNTPDFTSDLCVPSDDVAELEWLSRFVDDSFYDLPTGEIPGALTYPNDASFSGRARSKRSRVPITGANTSWGSISTPPPELESSSSIAAKTKSKREASPSNVNAASSASGGARRCTHCASEKTPQWRTGPMGPKTLCNACGVRYKSGRLVPEYRPAASPTFVLTQHSNSHRKVMELRRQKEMTRQPPLPQQQAEQEQHHPQQRGQFYSHHHGFQVC